MVVERVILTLVYHKPMLNFHRSLLNCRFCLARSISNKYLPRQYIFYMLTRLIALSFYDSAAKLKVYPGFGKVAEKKFIQIFNPPPYFLVAHMVFRTPLTVFPITMTS